MPLRNFETRWERDLTSILEHLEEAQFKRMLSYLEKIPQSVREEMERTICVRERMAQRIIQHYGPEESVSVIKDVMDQIPRRDAKVQDLLRRNVDELENKRQKTKERRSRATGVSVSKTRKQKSPTEKKSEIHVKAETDQLDRLFSTMTISGEQKSCQPDTVRSATEWSGKIKMVGIKRTNTYINLEVELNHQMQKLMVTPRRFALGFGLRLDDDFKEKLGEMPLLAEVKIRGNKIQEITKM